VDHRPEWAAWAAVADAGVAACAAVAAAGGGKDGAGNTASPQERQKAMFARMKESTRLERKGKDPIPADDIMAGRTQQGLVIGFLFARKGQEISLADKEVIFHSQFGPMEIKTKFPLKDMVYDGKLEL
jgi:hypothetical protein